jgi:DNA replication protein DnaC
LRDCRIAMQTKQIQTMSAILQHLNTITTLYMTTIFNTGNRMLDNSLVAIVTIIIGYITTHFTEHWREIYNMCIYHIYDMKSHPFELRRAPYIIQTSFDMDRDTFVDRMSSEDLSEYGKYGKPSMISSYITALIKSNNQTRVTGKNGKTLLNDFHEDANPDVSSGIHPIHIMPNGLCVYYCSRSHQIYTRRQSIDAAHIFVHYLETCYKNDTKHTAKENNSIIQPMFDRGESRMTMNTIGTISNKKTFDSLFYEDKPALINLLERFKSGTMYPPHIPMDNKLGILLYGPPGTGKTGTISAIANMLGRNLILVNFTQITTCKQLDSIFEKATIKTSVFVFDEFDCILDALGKKEDAERKPKNDWGGLLLAAEGDERKEIISMMKNGMGRGADSPIDLAYLLQKLDGLISAQDRIIIATTNHPDKINPALLRPGRFDSKLCLGYCTHKMVAEILQYYYKDIGSKDKTKESIYEAVMRAPIPDKVISPLELMNRAMQAPSFEVLLEELIQLKHA